MVPYVVKSRVIQSPDARSGNNAVLRNTGWIVEICLSPHLHVEMSSEYSTSRQSHSSP